jgi:SAM-dependent methyltransferase
MYSADRSYWWAERSDSAGHQAAYDQILKDVPRVTDGVYVDVACGNGNMLARLYSINPNCLILGTDTSAKMLELAKNKLTRLGADVHLNGSGELPKKGIVLILDDIINSHISKNFADVVLFNFPKVGCDYPIDQLTLDLVNRCSNLFPILAQQGLVEGRAPTLRTQYFISQSTKKEGTLIVTQYARRLEDNPNDEEVIKFLRDSWSMFGMNLLKSVFFEDRDVYQDTKPLPIRRGDRHLRMIGGYRISILKKVDSI